MKVEAPMKVFMAPGTTRYALQEAKRPAEARLPDARLPWGAAAAVIAALSGGLWFVVFKLMGTLL